VAALVFGIVLAGMAGDATATTLWSRARFRTWSGTLGRGKPTRRRFLGDCDGDV
jgi:hypothetical protein